MLTHQSKEVLFTSKGKKTHRQIVAESFCCGAATCERKVFSLVSQESQACAICLLPPPHATNSF